MSRYHPRFPEDVQAAFPQSRDDLESIYAVLREIAIQLAFLNDYFRAERERKGKSE